MAVITASDLYALSQGTHNSGPDTCHWCASPCQRLLPHDDNPVLPFVKSKEPCKRPGNQWICIGCWLWRRRRVTIHHLSGSYRDGQTAQNHSWLITERGSYAINGCVQDYTQLYQFLLQPTGSFVLSIISSGQTNYLQLAKGNDLAIIDANTPIQFTVDNVPLSYSIYALEQAIQHGYSTGKDPGIRTLFNLYQPPKPEKEEEKKRGRGRPRKEEEGDDGRVIQRSVYRSGS